jgi:hypothetical protein
VRSKEIAMIRVHAQAAVAAAVILLVACGGGGGSEPPAQADPLAAVPSDATQSAPAMVSYLASLSRTLSEVREAIDLSALSSLFTSETNEPESVQ